MQNNRNNKMSRLFNDYQVIYTVLHGQKPRRRTPLRGLPIVIFIIPFALVMHG